MYGRPNKLNCNWYTKSQANRMHQAAESNTNHQMGKKKEILVIRYKASHIS